MTLPAWVDKWITPQSLIVVVGFVIWLVQLNVAVMTLSKESGERAAQMAGFAESMSKTALILTHLEEKFEASNAKMEAHNRESEQWKYRIIKLEGKQDAGQR